MPNRNIPIVSNIYAYLSDKNCYIGICQYKTAVLNVDENLSANPDPGCSIRAVNCWGDQI